MDIKTVINNAKSVFLFSFLWGMGIAIILMRKCMDGYCVVIQGPNKKDIENKIYKVKDKCYTFETEVSPCKKENILSK